MADVLVRLTAALADRYRIDRELGQGGMATVYLAEDLKHRRQVAVKVLRPELEGRCWLPVHHEDHLVGVGGVGHRVGVALAVGADRNVVIAAGRNRGSSD